MHWPTILCVLLCTIHVTAEFPRHHLCFPPADELHSFDVAYRWVGRFCDVQSRPQGWFDLCWKERHSKRSIASYTRSRATIYGPKPNDFERHWAAMPNLPAARIRDFSALFPPTRAGEGNGPNRGVTRRLIPWAIGAFRLRGATCPEGYGCKQKFDAQQYPHIVCVKDTLNGHQHAPGDADFYIPAHPGVYAPIDRATVNDRYRAPPLMAGPSFVRRIFPNQTIDPGFGH